MTSNSVRVFYHENDLDSLVLAVAGPVLAAAAPHVDQAYFLRGWRKGPHVRLRFGCDADTFDNAVVPAAREISTAFLTAHPSRSELDATQLLPAHRRLAELEGETGDLLPWYDNNSIRVDVDESRDLVLGSEPATALIDDFYHDTNDLAMAMTEAVVERRAGRLALAYDLIVATVHQFSPGGIRTGFVSFRAHAEAFLDGYPEAQGLRSAWDAHYRNQAPTLVQRMRDAAERGREWPELTRGWLHTMQPLHRRAAELIDRGDLQLSPRPTADGQARRAGLSAFNQKLHDSSSWREQVQGANWFAGYRFVLNCAYLHLTRIGVTPAERFLLCHLAASAAEEAFGVSSAELIERLERRQDSTGAAGE